MGYKLKNVECSGIISIGEVCENHILFKPLNDNIYKIDLKSIIDYINNYCLSDAVIGDYHDLFYIIIDYAEDNDLNNLLELTNNIDIEEMGHKWFVYDNDNSVQGFSDLDGLLHLFEGVEILESIVKNDKLKVYCTELNGF